MEIYKKEKLVEERDNYGVELVPLTREGEKSKRPNCGWSFNKRSIIFSASTLISYNAREEVYLKIEGRVTQENLKILGKRFPEAVFVFDRDSMFGDLIYICKNEKGNLKVRKIYADFTVVDNLMITRAKSDAPYYPVAIYPISFIGESSFTGESYRGHKVYIDASAHEVILLVEKNNYDYGCHIDFGSVLKEMYYIDTRTLETKKVRKFFDGVEI